MMFLQATILTRIGNGPIWNRSIDKTEDSCRKIWWTGLLYVQNYVEPEAQVSVLEFTEKRSPDHLKLIKS